MSENEEARPTAERLVFFTDAITAIALTLLILPLLDTFSEKSELPLSTVLHEHRSAIGAFLLTFAVIFRIWWGNHRLFGHVETIGRPIVYGSVVWTLAIVVLPIATSIITTYSQTPLSVGIYEGTLVVATGAMTYLAVYIYRHPEHSGERPPATREGVLTNVSILATQILALVVGTIFYDAINFWSLLLMLLSGPIERTVKARWKRQERAAAL